MKNFKIAITEAENYEALWDTDCFADPIEAETEEEAIELAKQYIIDNGGNAEDYLYRATDV